MEIPGRPGSADGRCPPGSSAARPSLRQRATGMGKTWLACALAQYTCRQGRSALYLRVPRLAEDLRILHGSGSFRRWLQQLAKTDVLVLDDRGTGAIDAATRADLLEIIDDRSGQRATVITHQLPIEHWHAWLGDPRWPTPSSTGSCCAAGASTFRVNPVAPDRPPVRLPSDKIRWMRTLRSPDIHHQTLHSEHYATPPSSAAVTITEIGSHVAGTTSPTPSSGAGHDGRNERSRSPKYARILSAVRSSAYMRRCALRRAA